MLSTLKTNLLAVAALVIMFQPAAAASRAPQNTHDFIAYCKVDSGGCEDEIFTDYITMMFDSPPETCATKAQIADKTALRKAIINWIEKNEDEPDRTTVESIRAAFKTIYPCS